MDQLQPPTSHNQPASNPDPDSPKRMENDHLSNDILRWEDEGGACPAEDCSYDIQDFATASLPASREQLLADAPARSGETEQAPKQESALETANGRSISANQIVEAEPLATPHTFEEFWPEYLAAHSKVATRLVHYAAPPIGLAYAGACLATGNPLALLATPIVVYGPIFLSHWLVEGNDPKTLDAPIWSVRAELKMIYLGLTGQLGHELEQYGIKPDRTEAPIRKFLRKIGIIKSEKPTDSE